MQFLALTTGIGVGAALIGALWLSLERPTPAPPAAPRVAAEEDDTAASAVRAALLRGAMANPVETASSARSRDEAFSEPEVTEEPPLTAEQEAELHVARLEASGAAPNEYLILARGLEQEWEAEAKKAGIAVRFSAFRCFKNGCYVRATQGSVSDLEKLSSRLTDSEGFRTWPGGKFRSGPLTRGSEVEVTWAFFGETPDEQAEK